MSPTTEYILAFDLGTSGPKAALISTRGEIAGYEFEEVPLLLLPGGGAEQNPDDWWRAMLTAARRLLARGLVPVEDIAAVACSAHFSGTVPVDRDGRHLMNAIIWMDTRGAPYVLQITDGLVKIERYGLTRLLTWLNRTGGAPAHSGKDSIAHILFLKHERPEIYHAAHKFLEPADYLGARLTGQFAASITSTILHWVTDNRDIRRVRYDERLLALAGVEREKLPDLVGTTHVLGVLRREVAAELGLSDRVQVVVGTPDIQAAAVGSGAVRDFEAHLYIGTSSWLTCHVPFKKTDLAHNMASLPSAVPGRYFIANDQECAGACLTYLRDQLIYPQDELMAGPRPANVYQAFDRVAESVPAGSGRLIFTPWLYGERTPVEDYTVRGGFFNQSLRTTRAEMIRAVFEGVAFNARWLLGYVEQFVGRKLDPINIIGGGANSAVWCQIHADVFDRTIRQMQAPVLANARGVAFIAAVALGRLTFEQVPGCVPVAHTFEPDPAQRRIYDELFDEFKNIYARNRAMYARLNRSG